VVLSSLHFPNPVMSDPLPALFICLSFRSRLVVLSFGPLCFPFGTRRNTGLTPANTGTPLPYLRFVFFLSSFFDLVCPPFILLALLGLALCAVASSVLFLERLPCLSSIHRF